MKILTAFAVLPLLIPGSAPRPDVVQTDAGQVQAKTVGQARVYDGIPYAAPPVGHLRWQAPQPVRPWDGVRASKLGNPWPQQPNSEVPKGSSDEDCLYLNVTTPAAQSAKPRAVFVWFPGGGFFEGAGNSYEASKLASRGDVVVVTVNYRLGIYGFFGYPGLPGSGTFGLQDQQAALRWVQRNARAFGGDPRNVTIAGESAGGMSVCAQLTAPASAGLFSKAVMQSGSCAFDWPANSQYPGQAADSFWHPVRQVETDGKEWAAAKRPELACKPGQSTLDCLRATKSDVLLAETKQFTQSGYGGAVLPLSPAKALRAGLFHRVPMISGNNQNEATPWLAAFGEIKDYPKLVTDMVGAKQAAKVLREYPLDRYESPAAAWAAVTTDRIWSCTQVASSRQAARKVPVYAYEFADQHSPLSQPGQGAAHAVELPYLFRLGGLDFPLTATQQRLSDQMIDYWTAFARTGDPNGPGRPQWLPSAPKGLSLAPTDQTGIRPVDLSQEHHCDFWTGLTRSSTRISTGDSRSSSNA
ncbi:carboxylesterase family protein [Kribbella sandramycini]|uniref:Carboxylic ester hydrolase n=1 Tax=Kribbella sandramycini TaxID=60450 RepID=A0A7Y4P3E7_9ACTN|nr:carboxylesterase family protein [Kribbella sandramycini]MBB6570899.1 para-nitrobenzyl esterase [Kribbella sandramycini]NOL44030.1 carboxylesterase family protein [Kribbella sandramycini]